MGSLEQRASCINFRMSAFLEHISQVKYSNTFYNLISDFKSPGTFPITKLAPSYKAGTVSICYLENDPLLNPRSLALTNSSFYALSISPHHRNEIQGQATTRCGQSLSPHVPGRAGPT